MTTTTPVTAPDEPLTLFIDEDENGDHLQFSQVKDGRPFAISFPWFIVEAAVALRQSGRVNEAVEIEGSL